MSSRPLHSRSNGSLQKGMKRLRSSTIESTDCHLCPFLLAGSEVQHLRPSLVLSLQHVFANHPTLKLHTHCLKQRADADWQHYMRKILFVFLVSNLSGGLTCARMLWELIRVSQELLFLIGCSTGSKMKKLVYWIVSTGLHALQGKYQLLRLHQDAFWHIYGWRQEQKAPKPWQG